ncbi:MAG: preprotein translocase subunit SecY [Rickettsiales bacterium]|jgi:preprotein translocase subunit SecY|nr:preprotein translocase subunit SecY [Rickettsiales bacterium]
MTEELKQKIFYTIALLILYRIGTFIFLPGIDGEVIKEFFNSDTGSIFGLLNMFSGGAFSRMSIFALNIMPYITASIIIQLMTSVYKGLEELKKEGEYGKKKLNQYTKYLTLVLAIFQSAGIYFAFSNLEKSAFISNSNIFLYTTIFSLTAGTMSLIWLGDKITQNGIGNGISLLIALGIVSELPGSFAQIFELSKKGAYSFPFLIIIFAIFIILMLLIVYCEKAIRKIKIQYPNRGMMAQSKTNDDNSYIPLKLNMSGVIPPIFASSILMFPFVIAKLFTGETSTMIAEYLQEGTPLYINLFIILIVFFSFFYADIVFDTKEVVDNLKKNNCFVLGIRPGDATQKFLKKIINRITIIGAIYLCVVCLVPQTITKKYNIPLSIGGTGLLIIINTITDLLTQIQSYMFSNKYNGINKQRKIRVR